MLNIDEQPDGYIELPAPFSSNPHMFLNQETKKITNEQEKLFLPSKDKLETKIEQLEIQIAYLHKNGKDYKKEVEERDNLISQKQEQDQRKKPSF